MFDIIFLSLSPLSQLYFFAESFFDRYYCVVLTCRSQPAQEGFGVSGDDLRQRFDGGGDGGSEEFSAEVDDLVSG